MMARAKELGISIRSSNWLHYDGQLIVAADYDSETGTTPENLHDILEVGEKAIKATIEAAYLKNKEANPSARIHRPWLFTIKLADYLSADQAFLPISLENEAKINVNSNEAYDADDMQPWVKDYFDAIHSTPFVPRVPGRMEGWDQRHDGVWLQLKHSDQFKEDTAVESEHYHKDEWPSKAKE